jgi:ferrochelatase
MKTAVFLMNLGGPRNLAEVEPYLYELFADPLVVTAPFGPFRPLFAKLISKLRAPSSAEKYQLIGGGSPLVAPPHDKAPPREGEGERHGRRGSPAS